MQISSQREEILNSKQNTMHLNIFVIILLAVKGVKYHIGL